MKTSEADFVALKKEIAQIILALEDREMLAKVRALLVVAPTPKADLDAIDKSIAEVKISGGVPLDEYLKELATL